MSKKKARGVTIKTCEDNSYSYWYILESFFLPKKEFFLLLNKIKTDIPADKRKWDKHKKRWLLHVDTMLNLIDFLENNKYKITYKKDAFLNTELRPTQRWY